MKANLYGLRPSKLPSNTFSAHIDGTRSHRYSTNCPYCIGLICALTQTAWFLGFEPQEIPMLVAAGLLKPLGHPARNSTKFFATETLEQFRRIEVWRVRETTFRFRL